MSIGNFCSIVINNGIYEWFDSTENDQRQNNRDHCEENNLSSIEAEIGHSNAVV